MNILYRDNATPLPRGVSVPKAAERPFECKRTGGCNSSDLCASYGKCKVDRTAIRQDWPESAETSVNLDTLFSDMTINRLDDIAALIRALTYGEMMEFAEGLWGARPNEVEPLMGDNLPGVLHRWSVGR